jgi:hypothetical protein
MWWCEIWMERLREEYVGYDPDQKVQYAYLQARSVT